MRQVYFGIRLTEAERILIEERAQKEGRPASNLARHILISQLQQDERTPAAKQQGALVGVPPSQ